MDAWSLDWFVDLPSGYFFSCPDSSQVKKCSSTLPRWIFVQPAADGASVCMRIRLGLKPARQGSPVGQSSRPQLAIERYNSSRSSAKNTRNPVMLARCCIPPAASLASAAQRNVLSAAFPRGALPSGCRAWTVQAAKAMAASGPGQQQQQGESHGVELSSKKCVPCESKDMRPMSRESAEQLVQQVPGWKIVEQPGNGGLSLHRAWKAKTFVKGLDFFKNIAEVAEAEGHHPDLHLVGWNRVSVDISTHAVGGLTENDFILAAKINALDADHLLRKQSSAKSSPAEAVAAAAVASAGV